MPAPSGIGSQATLTNLNDALTIGCGNAASVGVQITAIGNQTVVFEVTDDGVNWTAILGAPVGGGAAVSSTTANGSWQFNVAGLLQFRARTSVVVSGGAVVTGDASLGAAPAGTNVGHVIVDSGAVTETNSAAILADTADIETNTGNIPPLGQALAAASTPVVLTAIQLTALTPPAAITGFALEAGHLAAIDAATAAILADTADIEASVANIPGPAARVNSAVYEASHILKATPGTLVSISGYNSKGSAQFIQLHDSATLPADTAVPAAIFTVPASSNFSLDVPVSGMPFTVGIVVCNSSTGPTKTIGAADCWFTAVII